MKKSICVLILLACYAQGGDTNVVAGKFITATGDTNAVTGRFITATVDRSSAASWTYTIHTTNTFVARPVVRVWAVLEEGKEHYRHTGRRISTELPQTDMIPAHETAKVSGRTGTMYGKGGPQLPIIATHMELISGGVVLDVRDTPKTNELAKVALQPEWWKTGHW